MSLHSALDTRAGLSLARPPNETGNSFATFPALAAGVRWHCAWTCQQRENIAAVAIQNAGFDAYLPLHYQPGFLSRYRIVPLFPRYVFCAFHPDRDPWGVIASLRGVCGLIRHGFDKPTALPEHAIMELMARTSERGIVDDPGDPKPLALPAGHVPVWQNMATLDAAARSMLLIRQFGERAAQRHMENAAA